MRLQLLQSALALFTILGISAAPVRAEIVANWELPRENDPLEEDGPTTTQVSPIQGWAYSTTPGATINRLIDVYNADDELVMQVPCCGSRGDVAAAYPGAPVLSGFSASVNWPVLKQDLPAPGRHRLRLVIKSSVGEVLELVRSIEVRKWVKEAKFVKEMYFAAPAERTCAGFNTTNHEGKQVAAIALTNLAALSGDGVLEFCTGSIEPYTGDQAFLIWDKAFQGFRLERSSCEFD